jgi:hypothetical protein
MGVITSQEAQAPRTQVSHAQLIAEVPKPHMFAQLTALSPDISRLSPADADVFRNAFQREEICYANSWLYLLRSTRDDQGGFGYMERLHAPHKVRLSPKSNISPQKLTNNATHV